MAEERCKVLTRSEGEEGWCIVIKPDGQFAKALHLIQWGAGKYEVNGKKWRSVNATPDPRERLPMSFEEMVEFYRCKDRWPSTADGPILESE